MRNDGGDVVTAVLVGPWVKKSQILSASGVSRDSNLKISYMIRLYFNDNYNVHELFKQNIKFNIL